MRELENLIRRICILYPQETITAGIVSTEIKNSGYFRQGMENADNIDDTRALIREIVEERYISGFGMFLAFNDSRRLRKSDSDVAVPFIMVDGPEPPYAERLPYSDDELNSNANAPDEDPGIFTVTKVNQ